MKENKTAWWALCEECGCVTAVAAHWSEKEDTPLPEEWEEPSLCMVCGGWLGNQWNEDDAADVHLA